MLVTLLFRNCEVMQFFPRLHFESPVDIIGFLAADTYVRTYVRTTDLRTYDHTMSHACESSPLRF